MSDQKTAKLEIEVAEVELLNNIITNSIPTSGTFGQVTQFVMKINKQLQEQFGATAEDK